MIRSGDYVFDISGELAMFTTPDSKLNCECMSYPFPTYSSIVGMLNRIYRVKGIIWVPDAIRVMNPIRYIDIHKFTPSYSVVNNRARQRFVFSYLEDPRYQVRAHYELDGAYIYSKDYNFNHDSNIRREIIMGGHRNISLGRHECLGHIRPAIWGNGDGYYDYSGESEEYHIFYKFEYNRRINGHIKYATFALQKMVDGVIDFNKDMPKVSRKW